MCFSAEADFAAAAIIAVPAVDALRHVDEPRELPLALIPALFLAHSVMSAFTWLWFDGDIGHGPGDSAAWLYALVAFPLLPAFIPWAIYGIEDVAWRKKLIAVVGAIGGATGAVFLWRLIDHGYVAVPHGDYVHWAIGGQGTPLLTAGYLIGTCGAMLCSGKRLLVIYGVGNAIAVALIEFLAREGFASIWCLWAALTSCFVALFLRSRDRGPAALVSPRQVDSGRGARAP